MGDVVSWATPTPLWSLLYGTIILYDITILTLWSQLQDWSSRERNRGLNHQDSGRWNSILNTHKGIRIQYMQQTRASITTEVKQTFKLDEAIKTKRCSTYTFLREHAPVQTPLPVQHNNELSLIIIIVHLSYYFYAPLLWCPGCISNIQ